MGFIPVLLFFSSFPGISNSNSSLLGSQEVTAYSAKSAVFDHPFLHVQRQLRKTPKIKRPGGGWGGGGTTQREWPIMDGSNLIRLLVFAEESVRCFIHALLGLVPK